MCTHWSAAMFLKSVSSVHVLISKGWSPGISGNKLPAVWVEVFKCLLFFLIQVVYPMFSLIGSRAAICTGPPGQQNMITMLGVGFIWWRNIPGSWASAWFALAILGTRHDHYSLIESAADFSVNWQVGVLLVWLSSLDDEDMSLSVLSCVSEPGLQCRFILPFWYCLRQSNFLKVEFLQLWNDSKTFSIS